MASRCKTIDRFSRNSPLETDLHQVAHTPLLTLAPPEFVMGVLAYAYIARMPRSLPIVYPAIALTGIVWLCFFGKHGLSGIRPIDYGVPLLLVFVGVVRCEPELSRWKTTKLGQLGETLGDSSYSLYLCHPFSIAATAILVRKFGLGSHPTISVAALVVASEITGYACLRLLERRLKKFFKRYHGNVGRAVPNVDPV
jgi:exopolysaccharide production protein ExoZ